MVCHTPHPCAGASSGSLWHAPLSHPLALSTLGGELVVPQFVPQLTIPQPTAQLAPQTVLPTTANVQLTASEPGCRPMKALVPRLSLPLDNTHPGGQIAVAENARPPRVRTSSSSGMSSVAALRRIAHGCGEGAMAGDLAAFVAHRQLRANAAAKQIHAERAPRTQPTPMMGTDTSAQSPGVFCVMCLACALLLQFLQHAHVLLRTHAAHDKQHVLLCVPATVNVPPPSPPADKQPLHGVNGDSKAAAPSAVVGDCLTCQALALQAELMGCWELLLLLSTPPGSQHMVQCSAVAHPLGHQLLSELLRRAVQGGSSGCASHAAAAQQRVDNAAASPRCHHQHLQQQQRQLHLALQVCLCCCCVLMMDAPSADLSVAHCVCSRAPCAQQCWCVCTLSMSLHMALLQHCCAPHTHRHSAAFSTLRDAAGWSPRQR
jgi:hypothetical protein